MAPTSKYTNEYLDAFAERITSACRTMDTDHAYIHEGGMFSTFVTLSMTAGGTSKFHITTPAIKYIHWRPSIIASSGDKVTATLYESCGATTATATLTAHNRSRLAGVSSTMTIYQSATITSDGTAIDAIYIGGGTAVGGATTGAESGEKNEIVMARSTRYSLNVVNGSSAANNVFVKLLWYEESDG